MRNLNKKYLRFGVKLVFSLAVLSFVVWKVTALLNRDTIFKLDWADHTVLILGTVFCGMILNWSYEAIKWKLLMHTLKKMTFLEALKAVFAGISTGIVTPNRLGNFIGRTLLLDKEIRLKATLLTLLANLAQFVVTMFFGCLGLLFLGTTFLKEGMLYLFFGGVVLFIFAMAIYIKPKLLNRKPFSYFFNAEIEEGIDFITNTKTSLKLKVLFWSVSRYVVFVSQYVFLLFIFSNKHAGHVLFANVTVVYLLMTIIPSLFFGKLFVREAAGLLILGTIGLGDEVILITGFLLWFINIALPSLIGLGLLVGKK